MLVVGINIVDSSQRNSEMSIVIHLKTLSSGERHPAARFPMFNYSPGGAMVSSALFVSITTSRLAVLARVRRTTCLVVWDWKSAQILFVRQSFSHAANKLECSSRSWKRSVSLRPNSSMTIDYWRSSRQLNVNCHLLC